MDLLLRLARAIDKFNDKFAWWAEWAVILSCFISCTNAIVRYLLDYSSNGYLEIQWYLLAACVMFGAAQVLRVNEHVRVDVLYSLYATRAKVYVDLFGLIFFLMPVMVAMRFGAPLPQLRAGFGIHRVDVGLHIAEIRGVLRSGFADADGSAHAAGRMERPIDASGRRVERVHKAIV